MSDSFPLAPDTLPSVTVAVCTRDNPDELRRCLVALTAVDYPGLDVLVVDNAPTSSATKETAEDFGDRVRYVEEPRPGLSRARNRALAEARGSLLAFADDDVVVPVGWLRHLTRPFENPLVGGVTGDVIPFELETDAQVHFEAYEGFTGKPVPRRFGPIDPAAGELPDPGWAIECGTGANMAFRVVLLRQLGGFDPALGGGTPTAGGDDLEMFYRVLRAGYAIYYEPAAVVQHRHRRTAEELERQITSWGSGLVAFLATTAEREPSAWRGLVSFVMGWLRWQVGRWLRSWRHAPGFPRGLIVRELMGAIRGYGLYRKSRAAFGPAPVASDSDVLRQP